MNIKVGIEPNLTPIKEYLNEKGYDIIDLNNNVNNSLLIGKQLDAIVVTGMSDNFLGIEDTATNAIVIDASGLTPAQVENEIKNRIR